jgi:hypothetical protein
MIDPEAFEIAFTAVASAPADDPEDDEPIPLCRACGAPVGIFPELALNWRHFRGDAAASGPHHTYDPGHDPEVNGCWRLARSNGSAADCSGARTVRHSTATSSRSQCGPTRRPFAWCRPWRDTN